MMNGFGIGGGDASSSSQSSTDVSSSSGGSSPRIMPSTTTTTTAVVGRSQHEDTLAALQRASRFFDGLDTINKWSSFHNNNYSNDTVESATAATETRPSRNTRRLGGPSAANHGAKTSHNRSRSSSTRSHHHHHSPSSPPPSRPVKCPPRRRRDPVDINDPTTANKVDVDVEEDHDDTDHDVQYLKRLYEMRTWDMYVRITEARKKQQPFRSTSNAPHRSHVPAVPVMMDETLGQWQQDASEDVPPLTYTTATGEDVSDHEEMIFSCDLE